jgi:spermidine synthase
MSFLIAAFILSGAAGLMYESVWSRYLALFVGHSAYAQVIVLVIFLGGMSVGAYVVGQRSERVRHPLKAYAYVELAVGIIGFLFDPLYRAVTAMAYDSLFPALADGGAVTIAKWVTAGLLILPQSVLLGATFPLMSAGVLRHTPHEPGRTLGLLYFGNSLGAAAGVLVAGFGLLEATGLPGTLFIAACVNVGVAIAILVTERRLRPTLRPAEEGHRAAGEVSASAFAVAPERWGGASSALPARSTALLIVAFGTAVASFIYEIAWVRMLSLVLGSATHSFELMLSAFILGLALGSYWVARHADRFSHPARTLGVIQWIMGLAAIATLPLYVASFDWMGTLQQTIRRTSSGYDVFVLVRYALCLAVMLPATFCAGMTLPLITRTLLVTGRGERAVGVVYAVNTLGSIVGAALAGLVLMPLLGLKMLIIVAATLDMALGALLLGPVVARLSVDRLPYAVSAAFATLAFVIGISVFLHFDQAVLTSGVFRHGSVASSEHYRVLYYRDGRTASVGVREPREGGLVILATNGKPDASVEPSWLVQPPGSSEGPPLRITGDMSPQLLLPLVALAHAPSARMASVIGHGSGITSHTLLGSPLLRELTTIEIEPHMVEASRVFHPLNRRAFEDPRSRFVLDDARAYFAAQRRTYDLILSEPSDPWVSGVSSLFTLEFYQGVRGYLNEGGIFAQWLQTYEMDDALIVTVLAALDSAFGDYEMFSVSGANIVIVATRSDTLPSPDWSIVNFPGIGEDLRRTPRFTPEAFERMRIASRETLHPMLAGARQVNSDFYPILDLGAERARFLSRSAEGFQSLSESRFDLPAALTGRRYGFGTESLAVTPEVSRVSALAFGVRVRRGRDPARRSPDPIAVATGDEAAESRVIELRDSAETRRLAEALYRRAALDALIASGRSPTDWWAWVQEVRRAEEDLHAGTAGVYDASFFSSLLMYARTQKAPHEAVAALEFLRGLASWDFEAVAAASPVLESTLRAGRGWISADLLRDGTVVAHMVTGDVAGARTRMARLSPLGDSRDAAYRFRSDLLNAHLRLAEVRGGTGDRSLQKWRDLVSTERLP